MSKSIDEQAQEKIDSAKNEIISGISETMDLYGVTPSAGTLYATLYLNGPMNLDEMRKELNMSKPSMSTSVRKLHHNGMVKKVYQQESRKHTYTAEKDFFQSFMSFYCKMWKREAEMNIKAVEEAEEHLKEVLEDKDVSDKVQTKAKDYFELIHHSKVYYNWLDRFAESVKTGDIYSFLPKIEDNQRESK